LPGRRANSKVQYDRGTRIRTGTERDGKEREKGSKIKIKTVEVPGTRVRKGSRTLGSWASEKFENGGRISRELQLGDKMSRVGDWLGEDKRCFLQCTNGEKQS